MLINICCVKSIVLSQIKVINSDSINSITILNDGRLATCVSNRSINIYEPKRNFNLDLTLKSANASVLSLCQLSNQF